MTIEVKEDEASPNATVTTLDNDGNIDSHEVEVGHIETSSNFDPMAAVGHALNGEPLEFANEIKKGLADRLQNAVERTRDEVAQAIFGNPDSEDESDDHNAEEGNSEEDDQVVDSEEDENQDNQPEE